GLVGLITRLKVSLSVIVPIPRARVPFGSSLAVGLLPVISILPPGVGGSVSTGCSLARESVTVTVAVGCAGLLAVPGVPPHQTAVAVGAPPVPVTSEAELLRTLLSVIELVPSKEMPLTSS